MKSMLLLSAVALLAPAFLTPIGTRALAQQSDLDAAVPEFAMSAAWTSVLHDEPGDGRLWSMGETWKASFGAEGAVYYPRAGSTETRRLAHALSPERVSFGGEPVAFERAVQAVRCGDRVELDRGAFTERYDLAPTWVEQSFVFDALPRAGDLVIDIPVASELEAVETDAGLEFRSERGRITYSRAVVVDALGRRTPAGTRIVDGSIVIRVAADVLATAALPLVVDPVLGAIFPDITSDDTFSVDAAFDPFGQVWVVVYERVFTAADHDVIAKMYSATGTVLATATPDFTSDKWVTPRIADLAFAHKFLVVAGSTAEIGGARTVRGRIVQPNGTLLTMDPQISISGALTGDCTLPDVGGDSTLDAPGSWCVVFQRASGSLTVQYTLISASGNLALGPTPLPPATNSSDGSPSISKSNGGSAWLVAWQRSFSLNHTIQGARIAPSGNLLTPPFPIGGGTMIFEPCASSPIAGTDLTAVVWQSGHPIQPQGSTIAIALLDGGTVLQVANLMTLEASTTAAEDQIEPSVDSDGVHFLVSYSEFTSQFAHFRMHVTDLAVFENALLPVQRHMELQPGLGQSQERSNVAATRTLTGPFARRYLTVYDYRNNDVNHDAAGRFVEGFAGGPVSEFCPGDGTGAACPCANSGLNGNGCANSVFAAGAGLEHLSGQASTVADTEILRVVNVPPGAACLFFQGTTAGAGAAFGDGLRCATGTVIRLDTTTANPAGMAFLPESGDAAISSAGGVPVGGGLRTYQAWYRNAASFCTSSTFNTSNGVAIQWAR